MKIKADKEIEEENFYIEKPQEKFFTTNIPIWYYEFNNPAWILNKKKRTSPNLLILSFTSVTVDKNGQSVVRSRSWEGNGRNQTAGSILNLPIKSNMRNLRIKIEKRTGLFWNRWQTIYDNRPLLAQPHRKITHWGTTLNSKVSDDDVL